MLIFSPALTEAYVSTITYLREEFTRQSQDFSTHSSKFDIFSKPFSVSHEDSDAALQLELIELTCDSTLQHHFSNNDLLTFHINHLPVTRYTQLAIHAKIMLRLFWSTYLCKTFFSKFKLAKKQAPYIVDRYKLLKILFVFQLQVFFPISRNQ